MNDGAAAPLDGPTPEQRRRNRVLGLALGALALSIVITFIAVFARSGLPKDPEVWRRMQQERSASEAVGGGTTIPKVTPATPAQDAHEDQR